MTAGNRLYFWDQGAETIAIIDTTGGGNAGVVSEDLAMSIRRLAFAAFDPSFAGGVGFAEGDLDDFANNYVAIAPQSAAEDAIGEVATSVDSGTKVWGTVFGGMSGGGGVANGYGGIVVGSHAALDAQNQLGGLGSLATSATATASGLTLSSTSGVVGVYGQSDLGTVKVKYALIGGISTHVSSREVIALGTAQTATSNFMSYFIAPTIGVKAPVMSYDGGELSVEGELGFVAGSIAARTEAAPGGFSVAYGAEEIGLLDARIGLSADKVIASTEHGDVTISGKGGVFMQSSLGAVTVPVTFGGTTQNFTTGTGTAVGVYGGMSLTAPITDSLSFKGGADIQFGAGQFDASVNAGLKASF